MRLWKTLSIVPLVCLAASPASAQDPVTVAPANYKVLVDNASVRVLKISYAPGAKSAMHQHPDAIVVPLGPSKVKFGLPGGKTEESDLANEAAQYMPAGAHSPENIGKGPVDAILVEFKGAAPGKAVLPASRPGITMKVLAEGARAMAYRTTAEATFAEPAGSKHDFDQLVVALGPSQLSLSIDGKPAKTTWARGDVQFIGRGVAHEAKNTSGKPVDMIIVAVK